MTVMQRTWDLECYLLSSSHLHQITLQKRKYNSLRLLLFSQIILCLFIALSCILASVFHTRKFHCSV